MTNRSLVGALALAVPTLALMGAPLVPVAAGAALAAAVVLRRTGRTGARS